jgi:hypothetical protein
MVYVFLLNTVNLAVWIYIYTKPNHIMTRRNKYKTIPKSSKSYTNQNMQISYIPKNKFWPVIQMEPTYWDSNQNKVPLKIFPPGFHFQPLAINKTQKIYEFILVDSDSISIKHYKDSKDVSNTTHSTIQILKITTPESFG